MGKKFNQALLKEELKKFRLLSEYSFYTEKDVNNDDNLILGSNIEEADEEPADDSKTAAASPNAAPDASAPTDPNAIPDAPLDTEPIDPNAAPAQPEGDEVAPVDDMGAEQGAGDDEVEVDVTQLVQGSEEAKMSAQMANQKTSELLDKFSELEQKIASMSSLSDKIDTLEKEIVKRNPTPTEKLELRSLDSFPYNIKLTDYFKDEDTYDAANKKTKEYVLTKGDIDSGFTDASIKGTFDAPEEYEEEDIYD